MTGRLHTTTFQYQNHKKKRNTFSGKEWENSRWFNINNTITEELIKSIVILVWYFYFELIDVAAQ